jgi:hypothetical protein
MSFRKILLIIVVLDLVLATFAYFVVFYNTPGTYEIANSPLPSTSTFPASSTIALASTTASSSIPTSSSTITSSPSVSSGNPAASSYSTSFGIPYPLTWSEGNTSISIMGTSLQGTQLTFQLAVAIGNTMQCVPLNIRILTDEQGDLAAPITPQFAFPETGNCQGAPGATYTDQQVIFNVNPASGPFFFTTGGASNIFFEVSPKSDGGLNVSIPSTNGG